MGERDPDRLDTVERLLAELTPDQLAALTAGTDMWHATAVPERGIPALKVTDGPIGARGASWVGTTSACAPCGTALGATWDPDLVREVGTVLGEEAATKSADVLLAPTVNLHRHPLAGRNFECFSEDPWLTSRLAVAYIEGVQGAGVAACVKHLVANDSEHQRHTISSEVDERSLRELYLVPFEAAVREAGVMSVMAAYNRLNGVYCAESDWLLNEVLRDDWGFDGVVMSDWWGAKSPASAGGGLDLEMPGPAVHLGAAVAARVRDGELAADVLDGMARHILALLDRLGLIGSDPDRREESTDRADHAAVLRRAARQAVVLLRNDPVDGEPALPIDVARVRRIAVIGPNADAQTILGGGSAAVNPHHATTVLEGIRRRVGDGVEVVHERGVDVSRSARPIDGRFCEGGSLTVDYFDNRSLDGDPVHTERAASGRFVWLGDPGHGLTPGAFSVRVRARFVVPETGLHTFALVSGGSARLAVDGRTVLDNFEAWEPGSAFFGLGSKEIRADVDLVDGATVDVVAEYLPFDGMAAAALLVGHVPPIHHDGIERAAAIARDSDVAVVVVGLDQDTETEGEDRDSLMLPGAQDDLVRAVAAANERTVVLVNAGAPVDLGACAAVPALAQMWYLGQETGDAVADVIFGDVAPSGRLPTTYGKRLEDWPSHLNYPGEGGKVLYGEQVFMGHRGFDERDVDPAFCFGHGLTYTTFDWGEPSLDRPTLSIAELDGGATVRVTLTVHNTGSRAAAEVVQCYVGDPVASVRRPPRELKAFARVHLEPDESVEVTLRLDRRSLAFWAPEVGSWVVEAGRFDIELGASSRDIRRRLTLDVED